LYGFVNDQQLLLIADNRYSILHMSALEAMFRSVKLTQTY